MPELDPLPAGDFSTWLTGIRAALRDRSESAVPCDGCTACCTSSQFVHVEPDEGDALAHIPAELLFPAPLAPPGHQVLGYDEQGRCPMLGDHGCTIYEHRPRACRTYDCRIFAATGIEDDDPAKQAITQRARRWRFDLDPDGRRDQGALQAVAVTLRTTEPNATRRAVRAVESFEPSGQG
jgi:Fe-S-cluster containining protein